MSADERREAVSQPVSLAKVPTGIRGIDEVLQGGLPTGRLTLVLGGPGTGKTVLGLEFLYHSALAGEPGILVSFEERAEALRQNALTLGWDLAPLERQQLEAREAAEQRRMGQQIRTKEAAIAHLRAWMESQIADMQAAVAQAEAELEALQIDQRERERERRVRLGNRGRGRVAVGYPRERPVHS